jgi:hypothetical protein
MAPQFGPKSAGVMIALPKLHHVILDDDQRRSWDGTMGSSSDDRAGMPQKSARAHQRRGEARELGRGRVTAFEVGWLLKPAAGINWQRNLEEGHVC